MLLRASGERRCLRARRAVARRCARYYHVYAYCHAAATCHAACRRHADASFDAYVCYATRLYGAMRLRCRRFAVRYITATSLLSCFRRERVISPLFRPLTSPPLLMFAADYAALIST